MATSKKFIHISNHRQQGFTLIEILIAIVILTFMMVAVLQVTSESIDTKDQVTYEDREFLQVERALERISLDFMEIYSPLFFSHRYRSQNQGNRFNQRGSNNRSNQPSASVVPRYQTSINYPEVTHHGRPIPNFESPSPSNFIFKTSSNRRKYKDAKESRYAWVEYLTMQMDRNVDLGREDAGLRLVRRIVTNDIYAPEIRWPDHTEQTLLNHVSQFIIEYWNPSTQRWVSSIELLNENRYRLSMIRVTLGWVDPMGIEQIFTRVMRNYWTRYDPAIDEAAYREAARPRGSEEDDFFEEDL